MFEDERGFEELTDCLNDTTPETETTAEITKTATTATDRIRRLSMNTQFFHLASFYRI